MIQPYKDSLDKSMNSVIGFSSNVMTKDFPEGLLGNFVADLMLQSTNKQYNIKADFSLVNNGGLRANLPRGNITLRNIYELMPFDNEAVLLELKGSTVFKLLKSIAEGNEMAVSGLRMTIRNTDIITCDIDGKKIDSSKTYSLVTSDYLALGGSDLFFLKEALSTEKLNITVRDMIICYIKIKTRDKQDIEAKKDGRIQFLK